MYISHWALNRKPFENTPDPAFLFFDSQHEEGLARMLYVVRAEKGLGLLSGVFGCGKTVLSRALYKELEKDIYRVAFITNPRGEDIDVLRLIAHNLGAQELPQRKSDVLILIEKIVIDNWRDEKKTVIIIDEAHAINDPGVFEEVRLLLNFQLDNKFLLTIIFIGQPELREKLGQNIQLSQRIALRYHLEPFTRENTEAYVGHRLKVAGAERDIFTAEALDMIYASSGGIPRRINQLCDMALTIGFGHY